jgi:hypothetical protein
MISVIAYKIWLTRKFDQRFKWFVHDLPLVSDVLTR